MSPSFVMENTRSAIEWSSACLLRSLHCKASSAVSDPGVSVGSHRFDCPGANGEGPDARLFLPRGLVSVWLLSSEAIIMAFQQSTESGTVQYEWNRQFWKELKQLNRKKEGRGLTVCWGGK